jgi:CubicO group peptidase (beta-lactamase class C family)
MTQATYDSAAAVLADHASGHVLNASHVVTSRLEPTAANCPLLHPSGGVIATASDYAHLAEVFIARGGAMLAATSVAAMEAPHESFRTFDSQAYGYGLVTQDYPYRGHPLVWHDGEWAGFLTVLMMVPDFGFAVVAMLNGEGNRPSAQTVGLAALQRFLAPAQQWPVTQTSPALWGPYAGVYRDAHGELGTVTVTVGPNAGGTIQVVVDAPNATRNGVAAPLSGAMLQAAGDEWVMPDGTTAAAFFPDATGAPGYLVTRRGIGIRQ